MNLKFGVWYRRNYNHINFLSLFYKTGKSEKNIKFCFALELEIPVQCFGTHL